MVESRWQDRWENRIKLTCRANESSIRKWIEKHQPDYKETVYYDWHPKDAFVAYTIRN